MNLLSTQRKIIELMARFQAEVKSASAMEQFDINRVSETMLIPLFSTIYGFNNLRNLNVTERANFPAIDLADDIARVAFQITATSTTQKIKETLQKFIAHQLFKKYDRLIIYILTERQKKYPASTLPTVGNAFFFDPSRDILDSRSLLEIIRSFQIEKARVVLSILEDNFESQRERLPSYLYAFTNTEISQIDATHSSLRTKSSQTNHTYDIINQDLIIKIARILAASRFFLIYGNSGRGKTFFAFKLIKAIICDYDIVIYYSPLHSVGNQESDAVFDPIYKIYSKDSRLLLVIDDGHLVPSILKRRLIVELQHPERSNIHLLFISRQQEEDITGPDFSKDDLMLNFNKIAEITFTEMLKNFCQKNNFSPTAAIVGQIRDRIRGPNLLFLTHVLRGWECLLKKYRNEDLSDGLIFNQAYNDFLDFYEGSSLSEEWKYINHVVSALFQYEIRIDKNYLTPQHNKNLATYKLEDYLEDRMIYKKSLTDGDKRRLYYVFMDFVEGRQQDAMQHAAEFRFYLDAYQDNLTFCEKRGLDRKAYSKLVLRDYILFNPINIPEVLDRIHKNAEEGERDELLQSLDGDPEISSIIDQDIEDRLNQEL